MADFLDTPIEYLKGVGPNRGDLLRTELDIHTFGDLLQHYPFRYVDRSKVYRIAEVDPDFAYVQIKGRFFDLKIIGEKRGRRLSAKFTDGTDTIELVWFQGITILHKLIQPNVDYVLFGKPSLFGKRLSMAHPEMILWEEFKKEQVQGLQPVYSTTEKLKNRNLDSRGIQRLIYTLISDPQYRMEEIFPSSILQPLNLMGRKEAFARIHFPGTEEAGQRARFRVKFEEFFFTQLRMLLVKGARQSALKGIPFPNVGDFFNTFYSQHLPFELTGAQKRVIKEIRGDMGSGKQMNRLLQGDVGSGKTMVAFMSMLIALDNRCQCALMAPTEILATQHYQSTMELAENQGIKIALLTGSSSKSERKQIHTLLESGELHILIGTHALIEDKVQFHNLGLVVIDEQHRFGVEQRAKLWKKGNQVPHILVMTATPIPRTLAMTIYGDLDVSVIDEMPLGRKPIETALRFESGRLRVIGFMREQIKKGRQVYVVYPLIEESEKLDYQNLMDGYEHILLEFPRPDYEVSIVHGRMRAEDKEAEMQRFKQGITQIMVATSVIEVGVNVPNASVMVIESAEKFGLSQLHQLRGRVGRGSEQSYCILMAGLKLSREARIRLEAMVATSNGFEIADLDLKLRGPGEIDGLRQSGLTSLKLADLSKDGEILKLSRHHCEQMLDKDPLLQAPEHTALKNYLKKTYKGTDWSRIS
ncbi:MAG: ATP-dependent DNA helicase RecG [Bacteroidota bacterium]|nr:ATP-dependent DNA helicase RecG [Bacteroidota bacterium]MDX5431707.1 ATP-dependent DNA helicase RecG [Bacteroidota bacterium]MDX5470422.1 ATP-dependent DNA helicase RecG [Bacteroidota bacterium]